MEVELVLARSVTPPRPGDRAISFSISPQGEAVVAWASPEDEARLYARRTSRGGASFPQTMLERPVTLRVTIDGQGDRRIRELTEVRCAFPSVHALPDDRLLVVGARAGFTDDGGEPNAEVFDADDRLALEACVGDGVKCIATTMRGAIWIGYFDEGVIGNFGWGEPGGRPPIGAGGLNCFDADLSLRWSHPAEDGTILDCYALTTTGEDCFICPYTGWPILRVVGADHRIDMWRNDVAGAYAMLAMGQQVALAGGYQGERDRIVVGTLERDHVRMSPIGRLRLPDRDLEPSTDLVGRDGVLHAFAEGRWYTLELAAISDLLRPR
jgi:hypothetical protein